MLQTNNSLHHGATAMTRILTTMMFFCLVIFSPLTLAETDQAAQLEQRLEQAKARLGLTDDQLEQMAPVLQETMDAQQRILTSYGIDLEGQDDPAQTLGVRKAMAMKRELDVVRADMLAAVEGILTNEQFDEFKRLQSERQSEMRKRIRGQR
jgi:hypothetical protein